MLFGDVLHHISLSSSTHTHPFEEREKSALKNESKEVTAKSAKAPAAPVLSLEFPVATGNSGNSTGVAGTSADFTVTPFDSFFKAIFLSLSLNGCVVVDDEKYIWCRTTPKSTSRSPLLIVRCFLVDSKVNKRE